MDLYLFSKKVYAVILGNISKIEDLLQWVKLRERANWSRSRQNRKLTPSGKQRKASELEQKWVKPEAYSKWKEEESKRVGAEVGKPGGLLQVEKRRKKKTVETRKKRMYNRDA